MRGGYPSKLQRSVVGYASEGSACLREAASAKAGPTKHVEEPRALARRAPLFKLDRRKGYGLVIGDDGKEVFVRFKSSKLHIWLSQSCIQPPLYIKQRHHSSNAQHIQTNHQIHSCQKLICRLPNYREFHILFKKQN